MAADEYRGFPLPPQPPQHLRLRELLTEWTGERATNILFAHVEYDDLYAPTAPGSAVIYVRFGRSGGGSEAQSGSAGTPHRSPDQDTAATPTGEAHRQTVELVPGNKSTDLCLVALAGLIRSLCSLASPPDGGADSIGEAS